MERKSLLGKIWEEQTQARRAQWKNPSRRELLVLLLPLAVLIFVIHENSKRSEIAKRQSSTIAVVTMHDPPNHDRYGYTFHVSGKTVSGWAYPHDNISYAVGRQVVVYYDPWDPLENSPENYNDIGPGYFAMIAFVLMAFTGVSLQFYFRWRTYRNKSTSTTIR
jgi:hypothetical protein